MTMKYIVIENNHKESFEIAVTEFLSNGWKLVGGVSVSVSESDNYRYKYYVQALVRDVEANK